MKKPAFKITSLFAREILDSRGNPTVEVSIEINNLTKAVASVPSGASTGKYEALELRDGDQNRYKGLGVLKAVENVNGEIHNNLISEKEDKLFTQKSLDEFLIELDDTEDKSRLGANAILGVSMAFARASAINSKLELYQYLALIGDGENNNYKIPQPMLNVINGGKHADSGLDIQEFMLAPVGFDSFARKIQAGSEIIQALKKNLKKKGYTISVGDEGGFAPKLTSNEEALDLLVEAIIKAGYTTEQIKIGMDVAASSFYLEGGACSCKKGYYKLKIRGEEKIISFDKLIDWYEMLVEKYPIILIEDALAEDDWKGFADITERLGKKIAIVGDDLLVTNIKRIKKAIELKSVNSVLIKINQIGTISETIEAINLTKQNGWTPFVSHRSGETVDTFIADLAVGMGCPLIKSGSLVRGERVCKYNRLMEIEGIL